jgi:AAA family ATP:ADP antiporter
MFAHLLQRLVNIREEEMAATLIAAAYYFALLCGYYMLRPLREEMGIAGGVGNLKYLYLGTLGGMLLANPLFSALVVRWPRHTFIAYVYRFFMVNLLVFFVLMHPQSPLALAGHVTIGRVFFVWLSVFNLFVISVFWGLLADIFNAEQGKRLFGFIAVGGTLGAVVGSLAVSELAERISPINLMLLSIGFLEIAVRCARQLNRVARRDTQQERIAKTVIGGTLWGGIKLLIQSPYLLGISLFLFLQTLLATFAYFEQANIVAEHVSDPAQRTALFARINLWVNVLVLIVQLFLTGRIIAAVGVGVTLTLLPVITCLGFAGLGFAPSLAVLVAFQVVRRASNFALTKPTKESLYTVVSREEKYKSKSFIDTFVYRGGDALGAWIFDGLKALGLALSTNSFIAAPVALLWGGVGLYLGAKQRRMIARGTTGAPPSRG